MTRSVALPAWTTRNDDDALSRNRCGVCGLLLGPGKGSLMLVRDSSAIHDRWPRMDGQRLVLACSGRHLAVLRERYRRRPFVEAELWAAKIRRAGRDHPAGLTHEELARSTGLDARQIRRALAWQATQTGATVEPSPASGVG